jgi:hypothetical protein
MDKSKWFSGMNLGLPRTKEVGDNIKEETG